MSGIQRFGVWVLGFGVEGLGFRARAMRFTIDVIMSSASDSDVKFKVAGFC